MTSGDKLLVWLSGEVKTPPFSLAARLETGVLLRRLQRGDVIGLPHSRPMPGIGRRCHELRVRDETTSRRIVYRIDVDAIVVVAVFAKKSREAPQHVLGICRERLRRYDGL